MSFILPEINWITTLTLTYFTSILRQSCTTLWSWYLTEAWFACIAKWFHTCSTTSILSNKFRLIHLIAFSLKTLFFNVQLAFELFITNFFIFRCYFIVIYVIFNWILTWKCRIGTPNTIFTFILWILICIITWRFRLPWCMWTYLPTIFWLFLVLAIVRSVCKFWFWFFLFLVNFVNTF